MWVLKASTSPGMSVTHAVSGWQELMADVSRQSGRRVTRSASRSAWRSSMQMAVSYTEQAIRSLADAQPDRTRKGRCSFTRRPST